MQVKTRWGILSTANIGVAKVIPAIQKASNCEVVAISSRSLKQAKQVAAELGIEKAYGSYEEMLDDKDIDVIYNPLPNNLHILFTIKALKARKHVLCEKPIALSAKDVFYLKTKTFDFPKLKVMEAFMYRFHPQWIKTKELVDGGVIGEVKTLQSFFSYFNINPNDIRNKKETGGGALLDIGCYCISFSRFIFNKEPQKVVGLIDNDNGASTDRLTSGILDFGNGISSTFTCSTQLTPYQRVNIFGTKGRIEVEIPVNAPANVPTTIWLHTNEKSEKIVFEPADQYQLMVEAFSNSILDNTRVPTSINDALNNMKVIDALILSAKKNVTIKVE